ncbi:unnamed protein product [Nippostrongylus brasiliensis]|uniref:Uncharacterized protein n=1 Tax=Nippostrongylus brasiliensis TaxID=27835 RepID=A0A0N4XW63_NIPBR|nr:unnamed protein product [Nippostrongylus brasiliensis]
MFILFFIYLSILIVWCHEELPGYSNDIEPPLMYNGEKMKFGVGTVKDDYGAQPYLQIPTGNGENLKVPKAFYHYTEREMGAESGWGIPSGGRLLGLKSLVKNNLKEINGVYLPLPNMQPINLHFITQRTFEKGIDTSAHDQSPDGALQAAKRLCQVASESECEKALLQYHRTKAQSTKQESNPLHTQLLNLGDLTSYSALRDREGGGMGVVVGVPGYDPLYVGGALDLNNDSNLSFRLQQPE